MRLFLILYVLFLVLGGTLLITFNKEEIFFYFNNRHTDAGDLIFPIITHLGGGVVSLLVALFAAVILNFRKAIIILVSFVLSGGIVQLLKRLVFDGEFRPSKYFEDVADIYTIPGLEMHQFHSFPSGHSATIFSLCCCLAMVISVTRKTQSELIGALIFVSAMLVAISRVYISQHFFGDIYVGSVIGVVVTLIVFKYLSSPRFDKLSWFNLNVGQALRIRE
ncbi:MAG: hypothetical protein COB85_01940 [Bacteroidetes bacterium]|nr:MAG: hypothetical protein COB85_01940 [Bacteroidota bacterium]